jgi:hypothetical protein
MANSLPQVILFIIILKRSAFCKRFKAVRYYSGLLVNLTPKTIIIFQEHLLIIITIPSQIKEYPLIEENQTFLVWLITLDNLIIIK